MFPARSSCIAAQAMLAPAVEEALVSAAPLLGAKDIVRVFGALAKLDLWTAAGCQALLAALMQVRGATVEWCRTPQGMQRSLRRSERLVIGAR